LRFNDLTQTVLAVEERTGVAATTLWRQCVDLLAQHDQPGKTLLRQEDRVALVSRLHDLRSVLSEAQRIASVVELGTRLRSPALVELFASDRPAVCAAAMARARLPDSLWPVLLSRIGPTARGVLRGRRDMGAETRRALAAFGTTDLVLGQAPSLVSNDLGAVPVMDVTGAVPEQNAPLELIQEAEAVGPEAEAIAGVATDAAGPVLAAKADVAEEDRPADGDQAPVEDVVEHSQIRQLVEKIERFTSSSKMRGYGDSAEGDGAQEPFTDMQQVRHFPFETDPEGALIWVGDASRTALIGLSIADPAMPGETGPDGHVAGAFSRRSSFQHGRMFIGEGLYAGEWRLSAVPFFDPATGRFRGYRGQARRPLMHEQPHHMKRQAQRHAAPSLDSMRQIVHELRTPLNAILGFAEIIEQQLFGPAGVHYREMASNILSDAKRLLAAFDDIDLVARSSQAHAVDHVAQPRRALDIEAMVQGIFTQYEEDSQTQRLRLAASANVPMALVDPVQCERMVQHMVRTLVSVSDQGEAVQGAIWFQPDGTSGKVVIGFDRPKRLQGLEEHVMLDPGYGSDGDWPDAPLLGLGFSMRLVRSLATSQGGALRIQNGRILIELPVGEETLVAQESD